MHRRGLQWKLHRQNFVNTQLLSSVSQRESACEGWREAPVIPSNRPVAHHPPTPRLPPHQFGWYWCPWRKLVERSVMASIAVVGAGFSGAVIARELAGVGHQVEVFDSRPHVAGNCHTERHPATGTMVHRYGAHIFHTGNSTVWNYVKRFDDFMPFTNRVKTVAKGKVYSLPINLLTINQFFGKTFSPDEAKAFLTAIGDDSIVNPKNFEEQALRFVGR